MRNNINARDKMTPREREEFEQERTIAQLQADYQLRFKEMEIELKHVETRWTQVFRLPFAIITLPVRFVFAFGYIAHAIRGTHPDDKFWDYLRQL
jgi:hypothetical protein